MFIQSQSRFLLNQADMLTYGADRARGNNLPIIQEQQHLDRPVDKGTIWVVIIAICGLASFLFGTTIVWTDLMALNSSSSGSDMLWVFVPLLYSIIAGISIGTVLGFLFFIGFFSLVWDFVVFVLTWDLQIIYAIFFSDDVSEDQEVRLDEPSSSDSQRN